MMARGIAEGSPKLFRVMLRSPSVYRVYYLTTKPHMSILLLYYSNHLEIANECLDKMMGNQMSLFFETFQTGPKW